MICIALNMNEDCLKGNPLSTLSL